MTDLEEYRQRMMQADQDWEMQMYDYYNYKQ